MAASSSCECVLLSGWLPLAFPHLVACFSCRPGGAERAACPPTTRIAFAGFKCADLQATLASPLWSSASGARRCCDVCYCDCHPSASVRSWRCFWKWRRPQFPSSLPGLRTPSVNSTFAEFCHRRLRDASMAHLSSGRFGGPVGLACALSCARGTSSRSPSASLGASHALHLRPRCRSCRLLRPCPASSDFSARLAVDAIQLPGPRPSAYERDEEEDDCHSFSRFWVLRLPLPPAWGLPPSAGLADS